MYLTFSNKSPIYNTSVCVIFTNIIIWQHIYIFLLKKKNILNLKCVLITKSAPDGSSGFVFHTFHLMN